MMPPETIQVVSFAGLVGDGAALTSQTATSANLVKTRSKQGGFSHWIKTGNPFCSEACEKTNGVSVSVSHKNDSSHSNGDVNYSNGHGHADTSEDENEDLLADFIDEDSQLPSRISKHKHSKNHSLSEDIRAHTGSSICVLR